MKTEDLVFHDGGERQKVEKFGKVLPHIGISVFSLAFVVESIDLGDLSALVIASQNGDPVSESHFHGY